MLTSQFEREALAHARHQDLLAEAAERRRVAGLRGEGLRERAARALVALAVRVASAIGEARPAARVA